jgi:hypothetical protein
MSESKLTREELPPALDELAQGGWVFYEDGVLWVCARLKRLRSRTRHIAVSAVRDVAAITAGHPLRVAWLGRYGSETWLADALSDAGIDPHEQAISVNLTGTSQEVPLSGPGLGEVDEGGELKDEVDVRARTVSELFAYWQQQCGHPHAMLSTERRRKIAGRLREGITPQQVREAIEGARIGAVVSGKKRFDDIELICRNAAKLESFIGREGPPVDDGGANGAKAAQRAVNEKRAAALRELAAGRGVAL